MSIFMVLNDTDDTPPMRPDRTLPQPVRQQYEYGVQYASVDYRPRPDQTRQSQDTAADLSMSNGCLRLDTPSDLSMSNSCQRLDTPSDLAPGYLSAAVVLPQMSIPTYRGQPSRPPRYRYSEEEFHFLWYHKNDLGLAWDRIEEKYRLYFDQCRSKGGLQCKLYRILEEHGIPKLRDLNRGTHRRGCSTGSGPRVNFMDHVSTRYEWMLPEHGGGSRRQKRERDGRL
ncbi:hypothetical protein DV735_g2907, partial [Chaetothyriales sp. CBS 134920]